MNLSKQLSIILVFICLSLHINAKEYKLQSPGGKLTVTVYLDNNISWSAFQNNKVVLDKCPVSLILGSGKVLGFNPKLVKTESRKVDQQLKPVVPRKKAIISDKCNELTFYLKDHYTLTFRVYDYGMAYRFGTSYMKDIEVNDEQMELNFAGDVTSWFPQEDSYISHNERLYVKEKVSNINTSSFGSLPVLFQNSNGVHVLFTEADLYDYPCMFLHGSGTNTLKAGFPKHILDVNAVGDRDETIAKEAGYIAKTSGTRTFPWRLFYISENVGDVIENDLVYQLSRPTTMEDTEWIKPGKVSWDWWNANNVYNVDFKAGINTATYKYYIDFAAKYGLEYIILDEGWSKTTTNVLETNPDIDMKELVRYGNEKGVGIILWLLWKPLDKDMTAVLDLYKNWGVKGIKVDFMQRSDQYMVNYYERVAQETAKRQLLVDFHGAFKPNGLHRAYPNAISYEGLKGMENDKWSKDITPEHDVTLPFIRMVAGPMDFTPGAMDNAQPKDFIPRFDRPMSQGTRCHQLAMYMVFESPLQMLADSPTNYYNENECTEFIAQIPTTWDDTKVLAGRVGEYVVIARKKGTKWFVGAMTNGKERELEVDFSFLSSGKHAAEIMQDGINAAMNGNDYKKLNSTLEPNTKLKIKLAPGGGWAAIVSE